MFCGQSVHKWHLNMCVCMGVKFPNCIRKLYKINLLLDEPLKWDF